MNPVEEGKRALRSQVRTLLAEASSHRWLGRFGPFTYLDPWFAAESEEDMTRKGPYYYNGERPGPLAVRWDEERVYRLTGANPRLATDWTEDTTVLVGSARPDAATVPLGTVHMIHSGNGALGSAFVTVRDTGSVISDPGPPIWREHRGNVNQFDLVRQRLRDASWADFPILLEIQHTADPPENGDHIVTHATDRFHSQGRYIIESLDANGSVGVDQARSVSVVSRDFGVRVTLRSAVSNVTLFRDATYVRPGVIVEDGRMWQAFHAHTEDGLSAFRLRFRIFIILLKDDVGPGEENQVLMSIPQLNITNQPVPLIEFDGQFLWTYELNFDSGASTVSGRVDVRFDIVNDTPDAWDFFYEEMTGIELLWESGQGDVSEVAAHDANGVAYEVQVKPTFAGFPGLGYGWREDTRGDLTWFRTAQLDGVNGFHTFVDAPARSVVMAAVPPKGAFPRSEYLIVPPAGGTAHPKLAPAANHDNLDALNRILDPVTGQSLLSQVPAADLPIEQVSQPVPLTGPFRAIIRRWNEEPIEQRAPRGEELYPGREGDLVLSKPHTVRWVMAHRVPGGEPRVLRAGDGVLEIVVAYVEKFGEEFVPWVTLNLTIPENRSSSPPSFPDLVSWDGWSVGYAVTNLDDPLLRTRLNLEVLMAPMTHWRTGDWLVQRDFLIVHQGRTVALGFDEGFPRGEMFNQTVKWLSWTDRPEVMSEAQISQLSLSWP